MYRTLQENDLIDIHSHHQLKAEEGIFRLYNLFLQDFGIKEISSYVSCGLHPWHIEDYDNTDHFAEKLEKAAQHEQVIALGETGLDRMIDFPLEDQVSVFKIHIELSEKYRLPLIVHCVKAYDELLRLRKESLSIQAWIVHGFNGSPDLAKSLTDKGIYISGGSRILGNHKKCRDVLRTIPQNYIFVESDENDKDLSLVYEELARCMGISLRELATIVYRNYTEVFRG